MLTLVSHKLLLIFAGILELPQEMSEETLSVLKFQDT